MSAEKVTAALSDHIVLALEVTRNAVAEDASRRNTPLCRRYRWPSYRPRLGIVSAATAAPPPFTAALALEVAPVRVNLIAPGFVDTPLSASLLGDQLKR